LNPNLSESLLSSKFGFKAWIRQCLIGIIALMAAIQLIEI